MNFFKKKAPDNFFKESEGTITKHQVLSNIIVMQAVLTHGKLKIGH